MKLLFLQLALIACLWTSCNNNSNNRYEEVAVQEDIAFERPDPDPRSEQTSTLPGDSGYTNSFVSATFDFDTTGWVLQDESEYIATLSAYAGRRLPITTDNILALYGKSTTVMEQPYFMVSVMRMSRTPSFRELSAGVGTEYMTTDHLKGLAGQENRELLAGLEADKPLIDKDKERITVRTSNTQDGDLISSLSTTMIVPGGVLNITGSYLEEEADELLKAYNDVLESLVVKKR